MKIFDDLTDVYEAMIDWPKRLANEGPFYRRCFARLGARSVADVACGTGHHAAMFHSWNLRVEGSDLSPQMIDRARGRFGEPAGLRWRVRSFDQPLETAEPFDVVLCVGNSLALAADAATVRCAIGQMLAAARPGGAILVHLLNLWRLPDGPCVWQKHRRTTLPRGEVLIVKGVHRAGDRGYVEFVVAGLDPPSELQTESSPLLGLEAGDLERAARDGGAVQVTFFGGYQEQPYDRFTSVDLLMVAEK
jgi:SAM-dependent methyltransferase